MKKTTTYQLIVTALFAAIMCIAGPLSVPIGPVPISLTNLVIYIAVFLLGTKTGTLSYVIYLLLGAVGLPVFSGYAGGLGKLAGPTGGYLIGFIPMALICGIVVKMWGTQSKTNYVLLFVGMALATIVAYALGTAWFVYQMQVDVWYALTICVFPFLIGDAAKIIIAILLGSNLKKRLAKEGFVD